MLCLVCSIVVAGSAVGLKPLQQEQRALDKQRNILAVAGLMHDGMSADEVAEIYAARVTPRLVDLKSGAMLDSDPAKFNQSMALKDPQQSVALRLMKIRRVSNVAAMSWKST
ncbi:Na(+)-translocating NADH-quinone reductase subunit C [Kluyvera cryocrescens]|uniref:Na(+)-translocating NADH-quinone reductase subunit C n=1 Tax=Kluyvera cryocrescens TaxID=580 RepID=A0A485AAG3_KLUCR|nr:Na(+)-translocating NADH-quinone reductase subunit C [Kluyvera cryocrescens]